MRRYNAHCYNDQPAFDPAPNICALCEIFLFTLNDHMHIFKLVCAVELLINFKMALDQLVLKCVLCQKHLGANSGTVLNSFDFEI
jgi:hypothetical protein